MTTITLTQLLQTLHQQRPMDLDYAQRLARAAFFNWVFSLPEHTDVQQAARRTLEAVAHHDTQETPGICLELFTTYLQEAAQPLPVPMRRGGSARRRGRLQ